MPLFLLSCSSTDANDGETLVGYDGFGHRTSVEDPLGNITSYVYGATTGRLSAVVDAADNQTSFAYDAQGRLIEVEDPLEHVTQTVYHASGNVLQTIDPNGNETTYGYDIFGRHVTTTDALDKLTTIERDRAGRMTSLTDAEDNETTFDHDDLGRVVAITDPLNQTASYSYNAANELISAENRNGLRIDFSYDAHGNRTQELWYAVDGTTVVETVTFTFDVLDRLLTAENSAGAYTLTYDALGRITDVEAPFDVWLAMSYDAVGNRTEVEDSFGGVTTSIYDAANRLTGRRFDNGTTELRVDQEYDERGLPTSIARYSDVAGTTEVASTTLAYDDAGRLTTLNHETADTSTFNTSYTYDDAGRLLTDVLNSVTTSYTYDITNQVTGDGTNSFTYDGTGNRTNSGYSTSANQLTTDGVWDYTYDDEGNLTKKEHISSGVTSTYAYDHRNRLVLVERRTTDGGTLEMGADYAYDAWGNRLEKSVDHDGASPSLPVVTRFAYDGWNPAKPAPLGTENFDVWADLDGDNELETFYLRGDVVDQLFARVEIDGSSETPYWLLTDRLGSVRYVIDASGTVLDALQYDAFGNISSESAPAYRGRYAWTGREHDAETGLQYNRARYYDANTGRWMSRDPQGFLAGDANLHRYVHNSPTIATDPSGYCVSLAITIAFSGSDVNEWLQGSISSEELLARSIITGVSAGLDVATMGGGGGPAFRVATVGGRLCGARFWTAAQEVGRQVIIIGSEVLARQLLDEVGHNIYLPIRGDELGQGGGQAGNAGGQGGNQPPALNTGSWGRGTYNSAEASLRDHFQRHGQQVGAATIQEYLEKAEAAMRQRRGRGDAVPGGTPNVRRFDVHGTNRYVDVDVVNEQVISFGTRR